jgi:hypothetical protein
LTDGFYANGHIDAGQVVTIAKGVFSDISDRDVAIGKITDIYLCGNAYITTVIIVVFIIVGYFSYLTFIFVYSVNIKPSSIVVIGVSCKCTRQACQ